MYFIRRLLDTRNLDAFLYQKMVTGPIASILKGTAYRELRSW